MTAQEIANVVGARVVGDGAVEVKWARSVASADPQSLVFVEDAKWLPEALESRAAVLVTGEFAAHNAGAKTLLIAAQPKLAFARAAALLHPAEKSDGDIHASAVIDASAKIGRDAAVGPHSVIEAGAEIGARSAIGANCVVGAGVRIGEDCVLKPRVTVYPGTTLGDRVLVHSGAVLGSDGFGYVRDQTTGKYEKFPQIG
ncbi:MAG TPA: LpxD N-terminal domain-containing protein, partial [Bradyrhizobium sp.]|nr:LpxD N-terminal domain-containing protein [Bradyrhizobium sp.]